MKEEAGKAPSSSFKLRRPPYLHCKQGQEEPLRISGIGTWFKRGVGVRG